MQADQWDRFKTIFNLAAEIEGPERQAFLDQACSSEPGLRTRIDELLLVDRSEPGLIDRASHVFEWLSRPNLSHVQPDACLSEGDILGGRFRILRFLGRGGMGEVYEAADNDLKQNVALKVLRPNLTTSRAALRRLRREVHIARMVGHPNVCRVYDLGREQQEGGIPVLFLTMELLNGETLRSYIERKGPLSTEEALPLIRRICEGLEALHESGVIHRDLKPANLILVESGSSLSPVITDFGLAGFLAPSSLPPSLASATGEVFGTPDYMAPEQLTGGPFTAATDIYSLGIIIYEIVTRCHPFPGDTPLEKAFRRIHHPPVKPRRTIPKLELGWQHLILHCLQSEPKERPQDASQVAAMLESCRGNFPPIRNRVRHLGRTFRSSTRRNWGRTPKAAWIVMLVIATVLAIWWLPRSDWWWKVPGGTRVLLLDLDNQTGVNLLSAITIPLRNHLMQSPYLIPSSYQETLTILNAAAGDPASREAAPSDRKPPLLIAMNVAGENKEISFEAVRREAWRQGIRLIVSGAVEEDSDGYRLTIRLEQQRDSAILSSIRRTKVFRSLDQESLLEAAGRASDWIRRLLGESPDDRIEFRSPADITTPSLPALVAYQRAENLKTLGQAYYRLALREQREALEFDPDFTLAHLRMGDLLNSAQREEEAYEAWELAIKSSKRRPVTRREQLRLKGLFASDTGDYLAADEVFRTWISEYPYDYLPHFYRTFPLLLQGKTNAAIRQLDEAGDLMPNSPWIPLWSARCRMLTGELDDVAAYAQETRLKHEPFQAEITEAYADFLQGDELGWSKRLQSLLEEAEKDGATAANVVSVYWTQAQLYSESGDLKKAFRAVSESLNRVDTPRTAHMKADGLLLRAALHLLAGGLDECRQDIQEALGSRKGPRQLQRAGELFARAGFPEEARSVLQELDSKPDYPVFKTARSLVAAEIHLAQGEIPEAIERFEEAADPRLPQIPRDRLAVALLQDGRTADAIALLAETLELRAWIWQGPTLHLPGRFRNARTLFDSLSSEPPSRKKPPQDSGPSR